MGEVFIFGSMKANDFVSGANNLLSLFLVLQSPRSIVESGSGKVYKVIQLVFSVISVFLTSMFAIGITTIYFDSSIETPGIFFMILFILFEIGLNPLPILGTYWYLADLS